FGIEVRSFDLTSATADDRTRLVRALHERLLLVIREQTLSLADQVTLTSLFGEIDDAVPAGEERFRHPDDLRVQIVTNDKRSPTLTTATLFWHTDQSFRPNPSPVIVLQAVVIPSAGAITAFANMQAAYNALARDLRVRIESLRARHRFGA